MENNAAAPKAEKHDSLRIVPQNLQLVVSELGIDFIRPSRIKICLISKGVMMEEEANKLNFPFDLIQLIHPMVLTVFEVTHSCNRNTMLLMLKSRSKSLMISEFDLKWLSLERSDMYQWYRPISFLTRRNPLPKEPRLYWKNWSFFKYARAWRKLFSKDL